MLSELLPAGAELVEATPEMWNGSLTEEEESAVVRAAEKRRREFTAGRLCARAALARLGITDFDVLKGADRAPIWPAGVVGSITHRGGYCAAVVARSSDLRTIGIDAEIDAPLGAGPARIACSPAEIAHLPSAGRSGRWQTVLFSAKEALYKAWFPLTGEYLGYQDVELRLDVADNAFGARLVDPRLAESSELAALVERLEGRFIHSEGFVLTAVWEPARSVQAA